MTPVPYIDDPCQPPIPDLRVFGCEAAAVVRSFRPESRGGLLLVLRKLCRLLRLRLSIHYGRHRLLQRRALPEDYLFQLLVSHRALRFDGSVISGS